MDYDRYEDETYLLGRQGRTVGALGADIGSAMRHIGTHHRWLYDGVIYHRHVPRLEDFTGTIAYFDKLKEVAAEAYRSELRLAYRFSSWPEIGAHLHVTRAGAYERSRSRPSDRYHELRALQAELDYQRHYLRPLGHPRFIAPEEQEEHVDAVKRWAVDRDESAERQKVIADLQEADDRRHRATMERRAIKAQERRARERAAKHPPTAPAPRVEN